MKRILGIAALGLCAAFSLPALAGAEHDPMNHAQGGMIAAANTHAMSEGTVTKVDKARGRITIKHGPLANLNMPPMTMVFRVKDEAMLDAVKAGDKVAFTAEDLSGALTVTGIRAAQ